MERQVAFVLGGGGHAGAAEVGMLHALLDREVKPDLIVGTSVGALHGALVEAAPQADVVLVAPTELEELGSFRQLHTRLPLARPIRARYWRVSATEVPHEQHALIAWVYNWWQTIDDWIDQHAPA